jgi:hypothetical protein
MHELPSIALLQQSHAVPKSGEELEVLGKSASKKYASGRAATLNEAVVDTVKHAGLSPEQVRRVVEFANVNAYLSEFGKEGAAHKYIEFHGGPASPAEVLHDLNDGGGGSVFDRGSADYSYDPEAPKTASLLEKNRVAAHKLGLEKTAGLDKEAISEGRIQRALVGAVKGAPTHRMRVRRSGVPMPVEDAPDVAEQLGRVTRLKDALRARTSRQGRLGVPVSEEGAQTEAFRMGAQKKLEKRRAAGENPNPGRAKKVRAEAAARPASRRSRFSPDEDDYFAERARARDLQDEIDRRVRASRNVAALGMAGTLTAGMVGAVALDDYLENRARDKAEKERAAAQAAAAAPVAGEVLKAAAAARMGVATMNDVFDDMSSDARKRYQVPPYAGFDPFGDHQRKVQVHMLSAMTGRQPVVHKYAEIPVDPGIVPQQPSLSDETRSMMGGTGGELASSGPGVMDPNAPPGEPGYDPLPEHMKLMAQHMKLMQSRAGAQAPQPAPAAAAPEEPKMALAAAFDFYPAETMLEQAFSAVDEPYPYAEPLQDSLELREKLAGAADHMTSELSALETAFFDTLDAVYQEVKVAALDGVSLGQVLAAWQQVVPSAEYVKTAFLHIGPRLQEEGVFDSLDAIGASLEKTAHVGMVNTEHPLISTMADYCMVLGKLAETREAREELIQERSRLDFFLKEAAALIPKAIRAVQSGANRAGDVLGGGAERAARAVLTDNPETAARIGSVVNTVTRATPAAGGITGGLLLADEAHDRLKYNRPYQQTKNFALSRLAPASLPYQQREARLMQQGGF